jgi:hypothetical protein
MPKPCTVATALTVLLEYPNVRTLKIRELPVLMARVLRNPLLVTFFYIGRRGIRILF